jgi:hypothetical protein
MVIQFSVWVLVLHTTPFQRGNRKSYGGKMGEIGEEGAVGIIYRL